MLQNMVIRLMHNAQGCDHTTSLFYKSRMLKCTVLVMYKIYKKLMAVKYHKIMFHAYEETLDNKGKLFFRTMHRILEGLCHGLYMALNCGIP